ncbi:hypothetical protein GCM10010381_41610 [Streptomyces xantholiticus]|nr:hypothetical protein GCM10010381_41610 [Streptomyces xantholiticus]
MPKSRAAVSGSRRAAWGRCGGSRFVIFESFRAALVALRCPRVPAAEVRTARAASHEAWTKKPNKHAY